MWLCSSPAPREADPPIHASAGAASGTFEGYFEAHHDGCALCSAQQQHTSVQHATLVRCEPRARPLQVCKAGMTQRRKIWLCRHGERWVPLHPPTTLLARAPCLHPCKSALCSSKISGAPSISAAAVKLLCLHAITAAAKRNWSGWGGISKNAHLGVRADEDGRPLIPSSMLQRVQHQGAAGRRL